MRLRSLDYLGYKDSQTSSKECELPFGTKGASQPTLLLRAGSHSGNPTLAAFGSNGTEEQRPTGQPGRIQTPPLVGYFSAEAEIPGLPHLRLSMVSAA